MRKLTTVFCTTAFLLSGMYLGMLDTDVENSSYKTIHASTMTQPRFEYEFPKFQRDTATLDLSEDLLRDLAKRKGVLDTVYVTKTDTIKEQVTKVKWRKAPAASSVMEINVTSSHRTDTIQVPVYYLATQVGNKEGPNNECIPVYEVRKVSELCPDSSVVPSTELDSIAGAEL